MVLKGFIHVYDCDDSLVEDFKSFAKDHACDRYNSALRCLLDFYKTFNAFLDKKNLVNGPKVFGGGIELNECKD